MPVNAPQEEAPLRTDARKGYRKDAQHHEELSRCLDAAWQWIRRNPKVQARRPGMPCAQHVAPARHQHPASLDLVCRASNLASHAEIRKLSPPVMLNVKVYETVA